MAKKGTHKFTYDAIMRCARALGTPRSTAAFAQCLIAWAHLTQDLINAVQFGSPFLAPVFNGIVRLIRSFPFRDDQKAALLEILQQPLKDGKPVGIPVKQPDRVEEGVSTDKIPTPTEDTRGLRDDSEEMEEEEAAEDDARDLPPGADQITA